MVCARAEVWTKNCTDCGCVVQMCGMNLRLNTRIWAHGWADRIFISTHCSRFTSGVQFISTTTIILRLYHMFTIICIQSRFVDPITPYLYSGNCRATSRDARRTKFLIPFKLSTPNYSCNLQFASLSTFFTLEIHKTKRILREKELYYFENKNLPQYINVRVSNNLAGFLYFRGYNSFMIYSIN